MKSNGLTGEPELSPMVARLLWHLIVYREHDVGRGCRGCDDDDPQCRGYYRCGCGESFPNVNWVVVRIAEHLAAVADGSWHQGKTVEGGS